MSASSWLNLPSSTFAAALKSGQNSSRLAVSASLDYPTPSKTLSVPKFKSSNWKWKFEGNPINIYFERLEKIDASPDKRRRSKDILMLPTISDVSTVDEWRRVAQEIVGKDDDDDDGINWSTTIVDWPGLGYSDRPKLEYNADVMERFLVDFATSPDSPISHFAKGNDYVIFGGGHAATIAVRSTKKALLSPKGIAVVAPTWSGPLPIVFGKDSSMETRYGLLRGTLRAPALGWMMYNALVSNEKAIESQYKSHVYADPNNVTPGIIESRYELTKRKGARYAPAAFLTGLLDPVCSREEFVQLFAALEGKLPVLAILSSNAPKRSKAEMDALRGAKGVSKFVEVPGALLPQEEYPKTVAEELYRFLVENFHSNSSSS